jgi:hypothetical protein
LMKKSTLENGVFLVGLGYGYRWIVILAKHNAYSVW